ncbi:MAG: clan AA aspartic protease, partial [Chromatiaceae bacterium]|nr:clan AA aspartic protease [Chromatiaceae bacterium]
GLIARVRLLLESFDHVIVQAPAGGIERIIILGEREPYVPPAVSTEAQAGASLAEGEAIVLPTSRQGDSHLVSLELEGARGRRVRQILLVDTGAEQVVLPDSLRLLLGIAEEALTPRKVQTANGVVDAQQGRLAAIWLGERRVADVEVAFIEGERLGAQPLLGMSLLKRFRMTIDDTRNELHLEPK